MANQSETPFALAALTAVLGFVGVVASSLIRSHKPKPSKAQQHVDEQRANLEQARASKEISEAFSGLVNQLQEERAQDRATIKALEIKIQAFEHTLQTYVSTFKDHEAKARANDRRCEKNVKMLCDHIDLLSNLMKAAGLEPPARPKLVASVKN